MVNKNDLIKAVEEIAPLCYCADFDNSGLIYDSGKKDINTVLICVDVDLKILEKYKDLNIDFIISHHPLIFKGIYKLQRDKQGRTIEYLIKNSISYYSSHTNFDMYKGGFFSYYKKILNIEEPDFIEQVDENHGIGIKGKTKLNSLREISDILKNKCMTNNIKTYKVKDKFKKIAVVNGSGDDYIDEVINSDCDTFISSDLKYHYIQRLINNDINVVLMNHFDSEIFFMEILKDHLSFKNYNIDIICDYENIIESYSI